LSKGFVSQSLCGASLFERSDFQLQALKDEMQAFNLHSKH
jgi:hypothetical protein